MPRHIRRPVQEDLTATFNIPSFSFIRMCLLQHGRFNARPVHLDLKVDRTELEAELHRANEDPSIHGIMIYYPVFGSSRNRKRSCLSPSFRLNWGGRPLASVARPHSPDCLNWCLTLEGAEPSFYGGSLDDYLRDSIAPEKDVEGLCHLYRSNLYRNVRVMDKERKRKCILPCTPLAVVKILENLGVGSRIGSLHLRWRSYEAEGDGRGRGREMRREGMKCRREARAASELVSVHWKR